MKVGLSTWSLLKSEVYDAVRSIGEAGFDYVELWGEVPHAYHQWVDKKKLIDSLSVYDMTLSLHAPFTDLNPANPYEPVKGAVEKTLRDYVKFGIDLGAAMITVHPGSVHSRWLVPQMERNSASMMKALVKEGGGNLSVSIENQTSSRSRYHFPLASTPESLELMLAEVEGSRFTLDTGHAHASGIDPLILLERARDAVGEIHLSDNGGVSDDHLIPGEGTANLKQVLRSVAGTDVLVCLELDPYRYSEDEVLRAASAIKATAGQEKASA